MRVQPSHVTLVGVFALWVLLRVFPLAAYPSLFSFDAWNHLGYCLGLSLTTHIPEVNPYTYPYYDHPSLHIFALLIHEFLGLPLLVSLQLIACIVSVVTFFSFYTLLRWLVKVDWQTQIAMVLLALNPDFLVQTNAPIPEAFALIFLPLGFLLILHLIRALGSSIPTASALFLITVMIYLTHHWTTLVFILGCFAILAAILFLRIQPISRGILATIVPSAIGFVFLYLFDTFTSNIFKQNIFLMLLFFGVLFVGLTLIALTGPYLEFFLTKVRRTLSPTLLLIIGTSFMAILLMAVLLFYPISRPMLWRFWKFAPLTITLGLVAIGIVYILHPKNVNALTGAFLLCWLAILSLLFTASTLLAFLDVASWSLITIEVTLAHRLFNYLAIAATPLAGLTFGLFLRPIFRKNAHNSGWWKKTSTVAVVSLIGLTFLGSSINVYAPAGGWYQTWFSQSEIDASFWLANVRGEPSITALDARLTWLFKGVVPFLPSNHQTACITPLSFLSDPANLSGSSHGYYFVTDLLEQQFMENFASPPVQFAIREHLDPDPRFTRIYSSYTVTIFYFSISNG